MKLSASFVAASLVAASLVACNGPRRDEAAAPAIQLSASHKTVETGERTRVTARTVNLVSASGIRWSVSPSTAQIAPEQSNGISAMFTANEPGTYQITASADAGNGRWVEDYTNITVNGVIINGREVNDRTGNGNNPNYNPNNPNPNPNNNNSPR